MDKKKTFNEKDFEYTIVMDASYMGPDVNDLKKIDEDAGKAADMIADYEMLYFDYEKMCLKWPTILDMDDAYPHSYQWRIGDRYDLGKMEALEEALKSETKIENTEAYRKYISNVTHRKLPQMSWD